MTCVFDASALLRLLDREAGHEQTSRLLAESDRALISAVHWGEVVGILHKRDPERLETHLIRFRALGLIVESVTQARAERSALLKQRYRLPYVDAFAVELAMRHAGCMLVTADYDFLPAREDLQIEFLPAK